MRKRNKTNRKGVITTKIAFVNGEAVRAAARPRIDKRFRNEDIAWLLCEARGELGERGMAIDPAGGGGSRDPLRVQGAIFDQLDRALPSVARQRRLMSVWATLSPEHQRILRARYKDQERQHSEVVGLRATFSDLAALAWYLCAPEAKEDLRKRLSQASSKRDAVIEALRKLTERANREAHKAWIDAEMSVAMLETEAAP